MSPLSIWNSRPEISEELVRTHGWIPDPDYPDMIWRKGDCVFTFVDRLGRARLENLAEGYSLLLNEKVPPPLVLSVCVQAVVPRQKRSASHGGPPTEG